MLDVFNDEAEFLIKKGIANLYWYKDGLKQVWLRASVPSGLVDQIFALRTESGQQLSKRQMMEELYLRSKSLPEAKRLEISRNFARILIEHRNFTPESSDHQVHIAKECSEQLKQLYKQQKADQDNRAAIRQRAQKAAEDNKVTLSNQLRDRFAHAATLKGQERGYEFERIFADLVRINNVPVEQPFRIVGEQIDGAIRYANWYYLVELKWVKDKCNQAEIASLRMKVEGKMDARGIFVAMEGYTDEALSSVSHGKQLTTLLLDGVHIANVIHGIYSFSELMDHALSWASLRGQIYCPHKIDFLS